MAARPLAIPRLERTPLGEVIVTHGGVGGELRLQQGDHLVVEPGSVGATTDELLLLLARGWGHPMLGRRVAGRLLAEPAGVPVSPERWWIAGVLRAIERPLDRGVPAGGTWAVAVRVRPLAGASADAIAPVVALLPSSRLEARALGDACARLAVGSAGRPVDVAVVAGADLGAIRAALGEVRSGFVRFLVDGRTRAAARPVLAGSWRTRAMIGSHSGPATTAGCGQLDLFREHRGAA